MGAFDCLLIFSLPHALLSFSVFYDILCCKGLFGKLPVLKKQPYIIGVGGGGIRKQKRNCRSECCFVMLSFLSDEYACLFEYLKKDKTSSLLMVCKMRPPPLYSLYLVIFGHHFSKRKKMRAQSKLSSF